MDLEYKIKGSTGKPQVVRVEFDPPLLGYDEVKPRLLSMKADADEALGTVRHNPLLLPAPHHSLPFPSLPPQTLIILIALLNHRSTRHSYTT